MLELTKHKAKLTSVNPRAELHGDEHKLAVDLHFETSCSNDVLSEFDSFLKGALYKKDDGPQGELINDASHLPILRFPEMGPVKWDYDGSGYKLVLHYGIDGKSNLKFADVQIDKFKFDCQAGGTVIMSFRAIVHPAEKDMGRLCSMIANNVDIDLEPPEEEEEENKAA